jgi:hypothetical protein
MFGDFFHKENSMGTIDFIGGGNLESSKSYTVINLNPKSECRNPKQYQMTKIQMFKTITFWQQQPFGSFGF